MARDAQNYDRRRFLQGLVGATLVSAGCGSSCGGTRDAAKGTTTIVKSAPTRAPLASGRSRVVVVRCRRVLGDGYDADGGAVRAMLTAGLTVLAGEHDETRALTRYVRASDRVGLKINGLAGRRAATHVEIVDALSDLLVKVGVEGRRQVAFDRLAKDLSAAHIVDRSRRGGYRALGNDEVGHDDELVQMPSSASRLASVLTQHVDGVINLPVLKQHMLAGMTGALKNNFGCIHNPSKMHLDHCDPYVAEVNAIPAIRDKQRLVIMDALRPVLHNGPSYQPGMTDVANTMLFATDLVAIDTVALGILDDLRVKHDMPRLAEVGLSPTYLASAVRLGLGVGDRASIDLVEVEV